MNQVTYDFDGDIRLDIFEKMDERPVLVAYVLYCPFRPLDHSGNQKREPIVNRATKREKSEDFTTRIKRYSHPAKCIFDGASYPATH